MSKYKKYYNNFAVTNNKQVTKKKTKKDWTYWVVVIALAFTFLGSILGTVAFVQNCTTNINNKQVFTNSSYNSSYNINNVSAFSTKPYDTTTEDITYRFRSSNLIMPCTQVNANTSRYNGAISYYDYDLSITRNNDNYTLLFDIFSVMVGNTVIRSYIDNGITTKVADLPYTDTFDNISSNLKHYYFRYGTSTSSLKCQAYIQVNILMPDNSTYLLDTPFTKIEIGARQVFWGVDPFLSYNGSLDSEDFYVNYIKYYQGDYLAVELGFLTYQSPNMFTTYSNRTYYTNNEVIILEDYQQGYNNGKNEGIEIGKDIGYQDGYKDGVDSGFAQGEIKGYQDGLNVSNQYNFLSLLGAVVDAPITALQGLLNFDLLGFNMYSFFTALLTVGIIIFVIRLFVK